VIFFAVFAAVFFVVFLVVGAVGWDEVVGPAGDVGPGGGAEGAISDAFGIDDDVGGVGFEVGELDVGGGDAEGAKEERCDFVVDLAGDEEAHDFYEAELDGIGVFERGEVDNTVVGDVHVDLAPPDTGFFVEVTIFLVAFGGRSALDAVDFDVLTAADSGCIGGHGCSLI